MLSTSIDYVSIYFEYTTLTKIHGTLTYKTLQELKNQLKANAATFTSDLGGGANGHLGLVCTAAEYVNINATAYIVPEHPGILNIPALTPQNAATRLCINHTDLLRACRESIDAQKSLTKQITQAIEPNYLNTLRNWTTNAINTGIQNILAHLMRCYGTVEADILSDKEQQVREM